MRLGREKLEFGGESGTGKTFAWMTIARGMPTSRWVVIELEDGTDKVLDEFPTLTHELMRPQDVMGKGGSERPSTKRVNKFPVVNQWMDFYNQVNTVESWCSKGYLNGDDWCVVEGLDFLTELIRGEFAEMQAKAGNKVITDAKNSGLPASSWGYFLEKRKTGAPILEPSDYDAVYTELRKPLMWLAGACPTNVIGTTSIEPARVGGRFEEDDITKQFYTSMGMPVRFAGYKRIPRLFDTHVLFGKSMASGYSFQVYRDRGGQARGQSRDSKTLPPVIPNRDFFQDFLVNIVGYGREEQNGLTPPPLMTPPSVPR